MENEELELMREFSPEAELTASDSGCGCKEDAEAELSLMAAGPAVDETPALAALESELLGEVPGILGAEELEQAAFEAELALASETLLTELEVSEEALAGEEALDEAELEIAEAEAAGGLEDTFLEDLVSALRKYPGLRITLTC